MAEPFKNIYTQDFIALFLTHLQHVHNSFDKASFTTNLFDDQWEERALKQRMRHISETLNAHLSGNYQTDIDVLLQTITQLQMHGFRNDSLEFMFIPDYIELYGLEHLEVSALAFERVTQFTSCEFGVRPFIIKYPQMMLAQMLLWAQHPHPSVRRLASEGCRPRLPWAMALPALKINPQPIIPILELLKNDTSESVRKSVANNINDISKDNPDVVMVLAKQWQGLSKEIDWVIKHGCRSLLKQGRPEVMALFGFEKTEAITVRNFKILTPIVPIGGDLEMSFTIENSGQTDAKIRLEYSLYYQKANGSLSKKVYKISEKIYAAHSATTIHRKQHFRVITTRKLHKGKHGVAIVINGTELDIHNFKLVD